MIRNTDAMMKAVIVQKKKEMLANNMVAYEKAKSAGAEDIAAIFLEWIEIGKREVDDAIAMMRNPSY